MRRVLIVTMVLAFALAAIVQASTLEKGREHTRLFYSGELEKIWNNMSPKMQGALVSLENFKIFRGQTEAQLGEETAVMSETEEEVDGFSVYLRTSRFEKLGALIHVQWAFDEDGVVAGFFIRPVQKEAPSEYLDYETQTALELPFEGEWYVFWGGRSIRQNYHTAWPDQRFAYDILMMSDGATHEGDGKRNEDYYCFKQPIFAPGAGVVLEIRNDVEDNVPGEMNPLQAMGNYAIIDHQNGEFSFLAHFHKGSVAVQPGQEIDRGELLGLCGNSGNSSEPHLHYHLQNTPVFGRGDGLPAPFRDYVAAGKSVAKGEPVKGQKVRRNK